MLSTKVNNLIAKAGAVFLLLLCSFQLHASREDSLLTILHQAKTDTSRAHAMIELAATFQYSSPAQAIVWADSALTLTREKGTDNLHGRAAAILGNINNAKGLYQLALKYFFESLAAFGKAGNLVAQANVQNSIGNTYLGRKEYDRALEAFQESARLAQESGDLHMEAIANAGLSSAISEDRPAKGIPYITKAQQLFRQLGDKKNVAFTQGALGLIYYKLQQYDKAEEQLDSALAFFEGTGSNYMIFSLRKGLGDVYAKTGREELALQFLLQSETLCRKMDAKDDLAQIYSSISQVYEATGDYQKALDYYRLFKQYNDSVFNTESNRQLYEAQEAFGSEKKQQEIERQKEQLREQNTQQKFLIAGICLMLIIAFLVFRQYRAKRRSNQQLEEAYKTLELKNEVIALKNKEITDSIHYARRIQQSFLPDENVFRQLAPDSLLMYKPKDIVSGDFYWMNRVGEYIVYAVADCTGHGVPGAFLSAMCNDLMNHVIRDSGVVQPGEILRRLDERLRQQGNNAGSHDGMDVAIAVLHQSTGKLQYAGARRPLIILRGAELTELEASRSSIGEQVESKTFKEHSFQTQPGDILYLFTDGYSDQFGGPHVKKFRYGRFLEMLRSFAGKKLDEQAAQLEQTFLDWKGDLEQIDDICILAIRL